VRLSIGAPVSRCMVPIPAAELAPISAPLARRKILWIVRWNASNLLLLVRASFVHFSVVSDSDYGQFIFESAGRPVPALG
jgi:hypothetical protein